MFSFSKGYDAYPLGFDCVRRLRTIHFEHALIIIANKA